MTQTATDFLEDTTASVSLAGWKKAAKHNPLLPSGVRVTIVIPDLPALIESGEIPQHLLKAAMGLALQDPEEIVNKSTEEQMDLIKQQKEFAEHLVLKTVVEPKLTPSDVAELPYEDRETIVGWATRQRDWDAEGEHIAGLSRSTKFRRFRGLGEFDTNVEGL